MQWYLNAQPEPRDQVPMARLKGHVERTFLSADEDEKLRVDVEQLHQREGETLASTNQHFREGVQRAYNTPALLMLNGPYYDNTCVVCGPPNYPRR